MQALKTLYYRWIYPNPRLHYRVLPMALFVKFLLDHVSQMPRQLLTVDFIRFLWCLPRYVFLSLLLRRNKISPHIDAVSANTIRHNIRGMAELAAPRSHILIRPLFSIETIRQQARNLKVLSIGPRTEGEIFNLVGYGFRKKNIIGLDLVSYSPYIQVGNMHAMTFPDGYFDVVICGWVLGYSDDKPLAAREILRVTKPGGTVALGVAYTRRTIEELQHRTGGLPGSEAQVRNLAEMEALFQQGIAETYFRHDGEATGVEGAGIISIFRKQ